MNMVSPVEPGRVSEAGHASQAMQPPQAIVRLVDTDGMTRPLAEQLTAHGIACRVFNHANDFVARVDPGLPGCVVSEWRFDNYVPGELLNELKRRDIELPVVVLTAHADVPMAVAAMRSGAYSVLQKPCPIEPLLATIQAAIQSDRERREKHQHRNEVMQRFNGLTAGERDVMNLALSGKMNREIAQALGIGLRTVEKRRHNVMLKMRADSLAELMQLAMLVELVTVIKVEPPTEKSAVDELS